MENVLKLARKLSFLSLVAAGMEVKEAAIYFDICVTMGYKSTRHWNCKGIEGSRLRKSPRRTLRLNGEMRRRAKGDVGNKAILESERSKKVYKGEVFGVDCSDE